MAPDPARLREILARQSNVVSRPQLLDVGADDAWIRTQLRAGRWQRVHVGVYAAVTGTLSFRSRAWAALLYGGPDAALSHWTAAYHHGFTTRMPRVIELSAPRDRNVAGQPGLRIHPRRSMPPAWGRLRSTSPAATAVDLADATELTRDAVGIFTDAVRARTNVWELRAEIRRRRRVRRRTLLLALVAEVHEGIESPIEFEYHHKVEKAHGLPAAALQVRQVLDGMWLRADRIYRAMGVRVELDGRLAHPGGRTDQDVWRDNVAVIHAAEITLRYRWVHVLHEPCESARQVALALRSRGWKGRPVHCGASCTINR
jgi:hypothetical protein